MKVSFRLKDTKAMRDMLNAKANELSQSMLEEMGEIIIQMLKDNIDLWYDTYDPVFYKRTGEILDAIKVLKIVNQPNMKYVEVYFDMSEISAHHKIVLTPQKDSFPFIIEEGWTMPNGVPRQGAHAFEETYKELSSGEMRRKIYEFLRSKGYDVTFK